MKKYTHAWLAFMAIKRLENANLSGSNGKYAQSLIDWFKLHRDGVIQGAWYPDAVIKDMANSHVLKFTPISEKNGKFKKLPTTHLSYKLGKRSPLRKRAYSIDEHDNLPDRCESIAHSVIDHLKMQESEDKGSPVSPTDNQVALLLFMLSHYIADAHVPFHCDVRRFSEGIDAHGRMEEDWENTIKLCYSVDYTRERFYYNPHGYPLRDSSHEGNYLTSYLKKTDDELKGRKFIISWGADNNNVWDFMTAVCQYSYLLSYSFMPEKYNHSNITSANWKRSGTMTFDDLSIDVIADAIDSIARVWFRVWRKYKKWEKEQRMGG